MVWFLLCGTLAPAQVVSESQIKAAYLYNFAKFIEWPAGAFVAPNFSLLLCVFGENSVGADLGGIVRGKSIAGHPVVTMLIQNTEQARNCHIVFISSYQKRQTKEVLESLRGASVLTVGEDENFIEQGGMINFVLRDERMQFEVNARAAEQAHIIISFRLLSVARAVLK